MYRLDCLASVHSVTDQQTDRQTTLSCQQPITLRAACSTIG